MLCSGKVYFEREVGRLRCAWRAGDDFVRCTTCTVTQHCGGAISSNTRALGNPPIEAGRVMGALLCGILRLLRFLEVLAGSAKFNGVSRPQLAAGRPRAFQREIAEAHLGRWLGTLNGPGLAGHCVLPVSLLS